MVTADISSGVFIKCQRSLWQKQLCLVLGTRDSVWHQGHRLLVASVWLLGFFLQLLSGYLSMEWKFLLATGSKLPVIQRPGKECVSWPAFPCPRLAKLLRLLMYKFMPSENLANIKTWQKKKVCLAVVGFKEATAEMCSKLVVYLLMALFAV